MLAPPSGAEWFVVILWLLNGADLPTVTGTTLRSRESWPTMQECIVNLPKLQRDAEEHFGSKVVIACAQVR